MLYRNYNGQKEIDLEYNAVSMVNNLQYYIDQDDIKNTETIKGTENILNQQYGLKLDETLDIFLSTKSNSPVLVFIHGGYWTSMSSNNFSLVAKGLVSHGITVILPNYSLCPNVSIPEITNQNRNAIAWISKNAEKYNGNSEQIFICGHSAGGQQVGMLAITDWQKEYGLSNRLIKGGIAISGIYDLSPLYYSWLQPKIQLNFDIIKWQSPIFQKTNKNIPMIISYGEKESNEFKRQSKEYHDLLIKNGCKSIIFEQKGKNHFMTFSDLNNSESILCKMVANFIQENKD